MSTATAQMEPLAPGSGAHTLKNVTINKVEVKEGQKGKYWLVWIRGRSGNIFAKEDPKFEAGQVVESIDIEAKESSNGQGLSYFLASPKKQGFGGGGGRQSQPKSREEIHAACITGLLKSVLESPAGWDRETAEDVMDLYWREVARVK